MRAREFDNSKLVIFDIDDTLVNTDTKVGVVRDGKTIKQLDSHDFTHYKLQPGEEFDFGAFRDAREFFANARPIAPMIQQLKNDIATGNKVIMVTARADFNDRDIFLDTFRKWGIDMSRVHVYRAGNIQMKVATEEKKKIILRHLLGKTHYDKVIMYDDAVPNLDAFLSLSQDYPWSKFYAWHVDRAGGATEYHRSGITETIRKIGANKWRLYSKDGSRNLGTFSSLAAAKRHEQEVQAFKHMKEDQSQPIRAYHGNQGGIDTEQLHAPMWFTASRADAENYAGDDGYVVVVDLDIKNPYRLRAGEEANTVLRRWQDLQAQGYDGIYDRRLGDWIPFARDQIRVISKDDTFVGENFADGQLIVEYSMFDLHHEFFEEINRLDIALFENKEDYVKLKNILNNFSTSDPEIGKKYVYTSIAATPAAKFISVAQFDQPHTLVDIKNDRYYFLINNQIFVFPEQGGTDQGDSYQHVFMFDNTVQRDKMIGWITLNHDPAAGWKISRKRISENFADGKKPGRKGLSRRVGIPKKATLGQLEKIAKSSTGERRKMAQWQLNMRRGKARKNK